MKKIALAALLSFAIISLTGACSEKDDNMLPLLFLAGGDDSSSGGGGPEESPADTGEGTATTEESPDIDLTDEGNSGSGSTAAQEESASETAAENESAQESEDDQTGASGTASSGGTTGGTNETAGGTTGGTNETSGGTEESSGASEDEEDDAELGADDEDDGEDLADGSELGGETDLDADEDEAEDLEEDDDDNSTVEDSGKADDCKKRSIELDTTQGKWYNTQAGVLPEVSKAEKKELKAKIKDIQAEIKRLRKDTKKGGDKKALKNAIALLKKDIAALRAKMGFGKNVKGIHTFWANQSLFLRVRNNCKAGWYKLKIVAKNTNGPLPDFYSHFTVQVKNESEGYTAGGVSIKAADNRYHRGRMLVYLDEGNTDLNLLWNNDAYQKGVYDANIQIKRIKLQYKRYVRGRRALVRRAHQFCGTEGRFFWDHNTVRTYWANQKISFCFPGLPSGKYEVRVVAKNYGVLPPEYANFEVALGADGVAALAKVPASADKYKRGSATLDLTGGFTKLDLVWKNDKYKQGVYDANIQIKRVRLKRVGDSSRSAVAAYLGQMKTGNRLLLLGLSLFAALGLGLTYVVRSKQKPVA